MSDSEGKQVGGKRRFNEGIVSRPPEGAPLTVSGVESSFEYGTFDRWHPPPLSSLSRPRGLLSCSAVRSRGRCGRLVGGKGSGQARGLALCRRLSLVRGRLPAFAFAFGVAWPPLGNALRYDFLI